MYTIQKLDFMRKTNSKNIQAHFQEEFEENFNKFYFKLCAAKISDSLSLQADTLPEKTEFQLMNIL